ncbi:MAG: hypothetical protein ACOZBZ_01630 [Patescibacteria group bacterium]
MNLEEELKKLKNWKLKNPPPISRVTSVFCATLVQAASNQAFKLFRDKKFREFAEFEKLDKTEQDRIFNELVVSYLVLLMLTLEAPDLHGEQELKEYFLIVKDEIPKAHLDYLKDLGIEKRYLEDWKKLIQMRYDEYSSDKLEARKAAMEIESKEKELTVEGLADIQLFLPVQTVAIGCHHHILRGKTEGKDELFKLILRSLSRFYVEIRVPLEGGEITFWGRLRAKLRHLWHKVHRSS